MSNSLMYEVEMNSFNSDHRCDNDFGDNLALGLFDGISIKKFIIEEDYKKTGLMPIINQYYQNRFVFEGKNSALINQTFLIYKNYQDEESKNTIETFINNEKWNFQFITFVYVNNQSDELSFSQRYNEYLSLEDSNKICIFDTLDNCSFISIIKTENYQEGLDLLLKLGFSISNNYCYSLVSLNKKYVNCEEEKINIKINMTIRNYQNFFELGKKIDNEFLPTSKGYNLGNTDAFVVYENITVDRLYRLFCENGLFNNKSKLLLEATFSISTHITKRLSKEFNEFSPISINDLRWEKNKIDGFYEKMNNIKNSNSIGNEFLYHLYSLIGVLKKVINYNYNNLPFLSIYPSLEVFINELEKIKFDSVLALSLDAYYKYLNVAKSVVELVINSSYHTHHDAISNIENNEISGKIITFYNLFTYNLVQAFVLNGGDEYKYGFLVAPQLLKKTEVNVLNNSNEPKNRLLIVHIPINQIYNICNVLISLVHECGHFIGDKTRAREYRLTKINEIIVSCCSEVVFNNPTPFKNIEGGKIYMYIKYYFESKIAKDLQTILEGTASDAKYLAIYNNSVRDKLLIRLSSQKDIYIKELRDLYAQTISNKNHNSNYDSNNAEQYLELMENVDAFEKHLSSNYDLLISDSDFTLNVITYTVFTMLRECFADLFAIVICDLDFNEYLHAFIYSNYGIEKEKYSKQICTRAALVYTVVGWNLEEVEVEDDYEHLSKIIDKHKRALSGERVDNTDLFIVRPFHIQIVWDNVIDYLKECHKELVKVIGNDQKGILKDIKEMYGQLATLLNDGDSSCYYNIDEVMNLINNQIYKFKK